MRELYLCFTPYHILLNSSIAYYSEGTEKKEMIIIEDFSDAEKIVRGLKNWNSNPFKKQVLIKGKFSVKDIPEKSIMNIFKSDSVVNLLKEGVKALKVRYDDVPFDRVFTCNDGRPQSQYLQYKCKKNNGLNIYVEDGSELYNDSIEPSLPLHESIFYKMYFGKWYEKVGVLGNYKYTDKIRAMRPELARRELRNKKIEPISIENFTRLKDIGLIESILNEFDIDLSLNEDYIILVLPHSSFLKERNLLPYYQKIISKLIKYDKNILLKYHPREKEHYLRKEGNGMAVIPQSLPSEILFLQLIENPPVVIGDVSTCLLTSKILKKESCVVSLINILDINSKNIKNVFKKIGVLIPDTYSDLENILKRF
ncbi:MAG: polysialyltransferase family glycosyltransferase [Elusimicrobiota bacterium]